MYEQFKELADVDITAGPMEVGPTTHYVMGGIRVDAETRHDHGARACSPPARSSGGMHGANRLGGNSLSDLLVFGARTGAGARPMPPPRDPTSRTSTRSRSARPRATSWRRWNATEGEDPYAIQRDLQATMQRLVGIFRVEADLTEAIGQLAELRAPLAHRCGLSGGRAYNPGWNLVFELGNLLTVSEAITRAALVRTESRGAHSRLDFPATDDERWGGVNTVVARAGGRLDGTSPPRPSRPCPTRFADLLGGAH